MGFASTSVPSDSCPFVRRHLTAGVAVASAGILALSLVAVPPDSNGARTEVRAVQLTTLALPRATTWGALLEKIISNQAQSLALITQAAAGATDIPAAFVKTSTAGVTTARPFDASIDSASNTEEVEAADLGAPTSALLIEPILPIVSPFLALLNPGVLLLFGPLIVLVVLACPPCALFNFVAGILQSLFIPFAPLSAVAAPLAATAELATDPALSDGSPVATFTEGPADAVRDAKGGKADVDPSLTSSDKRTRTEERTLTDTVTSTEGVTKAIDAEEVSTEPTGVNAPEPEAGAPTSEPTNPAGRPTPRPVVRDSLKAGTQLSEQSHPGNGGRSTSRPGADDDKVIAESSSLASSPAGAPSEGSASGADSSGDADGS